MPPTLAIYTVSLRAILREKVALSMAGLLLLVLWGLPSGFQTDGTLEGEIRMHILYSLGASFILLAGMTLWVSCASIGNDLKNKQLQMVLTKPVHRFSLWWGKWLAVVTLTTGLGLFCSLITWIRVQELVKQHSASLSSLHAPLTAKQVIHPTADEDEEELRERFDQKWASGELTSDLPKEQAFIRYQRLTRTQKNAANPGESASWQFEISSPLTLHEPVQISYRYAGVITTESEVPGTWILSLPDGSAPVQVETMEVPRGSNQITFKIPEALSGARQLQVTYTNHSSLNQKVFFRSTQGVRVLRPGGSFTGNLLRATLLLSGLLALLAGVGIGAGSCFSLPVACYVTSMILVIQTFSGVMREVIQQGVASGEEISAWMTGLLTFREWVFTLLLFVVESPQVDGALSRVAEGVLIPPGEVFATFLFQFLPTLLLTALIGVGLFSKREPGGIT